MANGYHYLTRGPAHLSGAGHQRRMARERARHREVNPITFRALHRSPAAARYPQQRARFALSMRRLKASRRGNKAMPFVIYRARERIGGFFA